MFEDAACTEALEEESAEYAFEDLFNYSDLCEVLVDIQRYYNRSPFVPNQP